MDNYVNSYLLQLQSGNLPGFNHVGAVGQGDGAAQTWLPQLHHAAPSGTAAGNVVDVSLAQGYPIRPAAGQSNGSGTSNRGARQSETSLMGSQQEVGDAVKASKSNRRSRPADAVGVSARKQVKRGAEDSDSSSDEDGSFETGDKDRQRSSGQEGDKKHPSLQEKNRRAQRRFRERQKGRTVEGQRAVPDLAGSAGRLAANAQLSRPNRLLLGVWAPPPPAGEGDLKASRAMGPPYSRLGPGWDRKPFRVPLPCDLLAPPRVAKLFYCATRIVDFFYAAASSSCSKVRAVSEKRFDRNLTMGCGSTKEAGSQVLGGAPTSTSVVSRSKPLAAPKESTIEVVYAENQTVIGGAVGIVALLVIAAADKATDNRENCKQLVTLVTTCDQGLGKIDGKGIAVMKDCETQLAQLKEALQSVEKLVIKFGHTRGMFLRLLMASIDEKDFAAAHKALTDALSLKVSLGIASLPVLHYKEDIDDMLGRALQRLGNDGNWRKALSNLREQGRLSELHEFLSPQEQFMVDFTVATVHDLNGKGKVQKPPALSDYMATFWNSITFKDEIKAEKFLRGLEKWMVDKG
eukprot:gene4687-14888_t